MYFCCRQVTCLAVYISISLCHCDILSVLILLHDQDMLYPLCSGHFQTQRQRRTRSTRPGAAGGTVQMFCGNFQCFNNNQHHEMELLFAYMIQ